MNGMRKPNRVALAWIAILIAMTLSCCDSPSSTPADASQESVATIETELSKPKDKVVITYTGDNFDDPSIYTDYSFLVLNDAEPASVSDFKGGAIFVLGLSTNDGNRVGASLATDFYHEANEEVFTSIKGYFPSPDRTPLVELVIMVTDDNGANLFTLDGEFSSYANNREISQMVDTLINDMKKLSTTCILVIQKNDLASIPSEMFREVEFQGYEQ